MDPVSLPPYVTNRGLFADRYLATAVTPALLGTPGAPADRATRRQVAGWLEEIRRIWLLMQPQLSYADTSVRDFVVAVYKSAGGATRVPDRQQAVAGNEPDVVLFADSAAAVRAGAAPRQDRAARFQEALAAIRIVRRETALAGPAAALEAQLAPTGLHWGILTDGAHWRLYRGGPGAVAGHYFEVALDRIFALEGVPAQVTGFGWFYAFFRPEAFAAGPSPSFLDATWAAGAPAQPPSEPPPEPPSGPLSWADAAEQVLDRAGTRAPMHVRAIAEQALAQGLITSRSRRPADSLYAQVLRDIAQRQARQTAPRFVKHGPGLIGLARWQTPPPAGPASRPM